MSARPALMGIGVSLSLSADERLWGRDSRCFGSRARGCHGRSGRDGDPAPILVIDVFRLASDAVRVSSGDTVGGAIGGTFRGAIGDTVTDADWLHRPAIVLGPQEPD